MNKNPQLSSLPLIALALILPTLAHAHTGVGSPQGILHGAGHPIGGLDHLVAMVAVGLWAGQIGGRALWAVPLAFVSVMVLGGTFGMAGISLPLVEQGIVASVLILGVLIAAAVRLPLVASMGLVGLFAVFHGYAHGAEMPAEIAGLEYGIGFMLSTALLHLCGMGLGSLLQKISQPLVVRYTGGAIALCGLYLAIV